MSDQTDVNCLSLQNNKSSLVDKILCISNPPLFDLMHTMQAQKKPKFSWEIVKCCAKRRKLKSD